MTREEFRALTDKGVLLGDGATGSNMIQAGMPKGVCTEKWICEHPRCSSISSVPIWMPAPR